MAVPGEEVVPGVGHHTGVVLVALVLVEGAGALGRHAGLVLDLDAGAGVLDALLDGAGLGGEVELVLELTS